MQNEIQWEKAAKRIHRMIFGAEQIIFAKISLSNPSGKRQKSEPPKSIYIYLWSTTLQSLVKLKNDTSIPQ